MWVHRLTEKDLINKTAVCSNCGPTKLKVKKNGKTACLVRYNQNRRKGRPPRNPISQQIKKDLIKMAKDVPCMDCGIRYPAYVMDFDHRDPTIKVGNLSKMWQTYSLDEIKIEIEKCDIVCSNCHRERTHGEKLHARKEENA
jgi:hypothetical protein